MLKAKMIFAAMLLTSGMAMAQDDPTIMTINGEPVSRSEFEYSYNKNNTEGVIDKKTVDEYVDLFVIYKLKVAEAESQQLDTLSSFKKEFVGYRDQQVLPSFISDEDVETEAKEYYQRTYDAIGENGILDASHILLRLAQDATDEQKAAVKERADSVYAALKAGADFAELATRLSEDPGSARNGGKLPKFVKGQMVKEFEDMAFSLNPGDTSEPFTSAFGYHIIRMNGRESLQPYDSIRAQIVNYLEQRGVRSVLVERKLKQMVDDSNGAETREALIAKRIEEKEAEDPDLKYLIKEYHDGLLLFEVSNRMVWEKASKDATGLANYFKKNKKKYKWDAPRFKGIAYHVKEAGDVQAVKDCIKKVPFSQWAERLRETFNNDGPIRIRVEKGIFKQGDNKLIDRDEFHVAGTQVTTLKDFPIDATFGRLIKAPEEYEDVKGLVVSDYQDELEKAWIDTLRKKYPVVINKDVLSTVNKH